MALHEFKWRKGNPPHVGWWCANCIESKNIWSWWDGKNWSIGYLDVDPQPPRSASQLPRRWTVPMWCWHWPANARVKRIDPATGEVTGPVPKRRRIPRA